MGVPPIQSQVDWGTWRVQQKDDGPATLQWVDHNTGEAVDLHTFTGEIVRMDIREDQPDADTRNYEIVVSGDRAGEERKPGAGNTTDIHVYGCGQKSASSDIAAFERIGDRICSALDRFGERISALERSLGQGTSSTPGAGAPARERTPPAAAGPPLQQMLDRINAMHQELTEMAQQMTQTGPDDAKHRDRPRPGADALDQYLGLRQRLGAIEEALERFLCAAPPGSGRAASRAGPDLAARSSGLPESMLDEMRSMRREVAELTRRIETLRADQMRATLDAQVQFDGLHDRIGRIEEALRRFGDVARPGADRAAGDPQPKPSAGTVEGHRATHEPDDDGAGLRDSVDRRMSDQHETEERPDELDLLLADLASSTSPGMHGQPHGAGDGLVRAASSVAEALHELCRVACEPPGTDDPSAAGDRDSRPTDQPARAATQPKRPWQEALAQRQRTTSESAVGGAPRMVDALVKQEKLHPKLLPHLSDLRKLGDCRAALESAEQVLGIKTPVLKSHASPAARVDHITGILRERSIEYPDVDLLGVTLWCQCVALGEMLRRDVGRKGGSWQFNLVGDSTRGEVSSSVAGLSILGIRTPDERRTVGLREIPARRDGSYLVSAGDTEYWGTDVGLEQRTESGRRVIADLVGEEFAAVDSYIVFAVGKITLAIASAGPGVPVAGSTGPADPRPKAES